MSLFYPTTLPCPSCAEPVDFQACGSVAADRRPDIRDDIIRGTFQRGTCGKCGTVFRMDPNLVYLDVGRNQWIVAHPVSEVGNWEQLEQSARNVFAKSYGELASQDAQEIGRELVLRIVFGWAALREKLLLAENQLSDVNFELLKIALLRGMDEPPLSNDTEMRLTEVDTDQDEIELASIVSQGEHLVETVRIPRELYDEIASDADQWQSLREEISAGYFVDIRRLIVTGTT